MVEKLAFNLSNFQYQDFPFLEKLINYVIQEADAKVKQMLDRSCKYFYKEAPYLIIDTLEYNEKKERLENEAYDGCVDFLDYQEYEHFFEKVEFIWVTKKLNISFWHALRPKFIDDIYRCDASEVSIFNAIWPLCEFKKLTKSGKVECLDLMNTSIVSGPDESPVPLEDVLALVPNARIIRVDDCHVTDETMTKLLAIPWKQKITEFSLNNVDGPLCANLVFEFVKKHVDAETKINVDFTFENNEFEELFNQKMAKSDVNLHPSGAMEEFVNYETTVAAPPPPFKKQTWMNTFHSIFCNYFRKKLPVITEVERQLNGQPDDDEPMLVEEPMLIAEPKLDEDSVLKKKVVYNNENIERQYTAFPYPHMCYISENADAETWKKLERTCKFFCQKNPYLMVDDFHVGTDDKITLIVDNKKIMFENEEEMDKPLWITNSIDFAGMGKFNMDDRVDAIKILTRSVVHSMDNFIRLTGSGNVKEWYSIDALIKNNDFSKVKSLNELLIHLPNVEIFRAKVRGIHPCYPNEPISLPQNNKIKYLEIIFLKDPILAESLFDVLKTSLVPKAAVEIDLSDLIEQMNVEEFKAQIKAKLDTWKPQIDKPTFKIVY